MEMLLNPISQQQLDKLQEVADKHKIYKGRSEFLADTDFNFLEGKFVDVMDLKLKILKQYAKLPKKKSARDGLFTWLVLNAPNEGDLSIVLGNIQTLVRMATQKP